MYWLPVYRRKIARVLLILFSLMMVNSVVFRHAHKLASGRIIVHAHPFKPVGDSPYQPNTHTTNELVWLENFTNLLYDGLTPFVFACVVLSAPATQRFWSVYSFQSAYVFPYFSRRGPPVVG
ncbi:hypothetical protein [Larkinella punicea]|uniref:Uncharacterized protein n=1 Tax=Larkinella punicea TaxID=2315727 RepID=A0A368JIH7_9BACT|nr:hypothetical protein [Larkinella punicea]RCR66484.1 hypothetical protein DUE52_26795 [Larkinella punicea]